MITPTRRESSLVRTYSLLIVVIFLKPISNLLFAGGLKSPTLTLSTDNPVSFVVALFHPLVAAGVLLQILWLLTRMALLSRADLSFVLPATASGYVISALLGRVFLFEQISWKHWVGIVLIFVGSTFAGSTALKTVEAIPLGGRRSGHE